MTAMTMGAAIKSDEAGGLATATKSEVKHTDR
jgi:hypothetical protein